MQWPALEVVVGAIGFERIQSRVRSQRERKRSRFVVFDRLRQAAFVVSAQSQKRNSGLLEFFRQGGQGLQLLGTVQALISQVKSQDDRSSAILRQRDLAPFSV